MKRFFIILFFCVFICAFNPLDFSGINCTSDNDEQLYVPANQSSVGKSYIDWKAQKFILTTSARIWIYKVSECDNNSDTGSNTVVIVNHKETDANCGGGGDCPDESSEVTNTTLTFNASAMSNCGTTTADEYTHSNFVNLPPGTYWAIMKETASADVGIDHSTSSTGDRCAWSDDAGTTWSTLDNCSYNIEIIGWH